jgi:hypothetical protein
MKDLAKAEQVASEIGYFYYNMETGTEHEKVVKATEAIKFLEIEDIEYDDGIVTISLQRPGLIIGKKGENIDALLEYLKRSVPMEYGGSVPLKIEKIKIVETKEITGLFDFAVLDRYGFDHDFDDSCYVGEYRNN